MLDREIVLYGAGFEGEKFYWQYYDKFKIVFAIDRLNNRDFHGLHVYSLEEVRGDIEKYQIVVAAVWETYLAIKKGLEALGLREFTHFTWSADFGKKLCILYGNCHMGILEEYLHNNSFFSRDYVMRHFFATHNPHACNVPGEWELANCDLLISQDIRKNSNNLFPGVNELKAQVPSTCRCIVIPNLFGYNLFFPQGRETAALDRHMGEGSISCEKKTERELDEVKYLVNMHCIGDANIARLHREGKNIEQIVAQLKEASIYPVAKIKENFEKELQRIRERETDCDIRIADFIEENFQREKLFWDPRHPSKAVICEKGRRILQLLHISIDESIPVKNEPDIAELYIYGCVKKALGLRFEEQYMRRVKIKTLTNNPISLREYVEQSIRWPSDLECPHKVF